MKYKLLLLAIILGLPNFIYSQEKIKSNLELMAFMGRVPQKTVMNVLPDNLLIMLYYDIQPENKLDVGYMDVDGNIIVEPQYNMGSDFFGETANIIKDSTFGYIDKNGVETLLDAYDKTFFYYGNSGIANKDGKYALIDRKGALLTDFNYTMINFFDHNFYQAHWPDKTSQILNDKGEVIFNKERTYAIKSHFLEKDSIIIFQDTVKGQELNGLITLKEEIILEPSYES